MIGIRGGIVLLVGGTEFDGNGGAELPGSASKSGGTS